MTYWENALMVGFGVVLVVVGLRSTATGVLGFLFTGGSLVAWGLFGGIEEAVRRGTEREDPAPTEPEE